MTEALKKIVFICFLSISLIKINAQNVDLEYLIQVESEIAGMFDSLYNLPPGTESLSLNEEILQRFEQALKLDESVFYPWKKLVKIGKISSKEKRLKIFTWYLTLENGEYQYYGFIQYQSGKKKRMENKVFQLSDHSENMINPEIKNLTAENWYGALYFDMISFTHKKKTFYAILGFDFNTPSSNKKLIEVLQFNRKGQPSFGGDFKMELDNKQRIIFEYSRDIVMTLKYDKRLKMIVFDHLSPFNPILSGNYAFYGPDGSYDGLSFEDGEFIINRDVDARNY